MNFLKKILLVKVNRSGTKKRNKMFMIDYFTEAIKRRKQQNTLNIYLTFWAWVAQFFTNMFNLVLIHAFFGKNIFAHAISALFHLTLNFNVLPFFYMVFADESIKAAIYYKQYKEVLRLFLSF